MGLQKIKFILNLVLPTSFWEPGQSWTWIIFHSESLWDSNQVPHTYSDSLQLLANLSHRISFMSLKCSFVLS